MLPRSECYQKRQNPGQRRLTTSTGLRGHRSQQGTTGNSRASHCLFLFELCPLFYAEMKGKRQKVAKEDPGDPQGDTAELLPTAPHPPAVNPGLEHYGEHSHCPNHTYELSCSQQACLIFFFPRLIQFLG